MQTIFLVLFLIQLLLLYTEASSSVQYNKAGSKSKQSSASSLYSTPSSLGAHGIGRIHLSDSEPNTLFKINDQIDRIRDAWTITPGYVEALELSFREFPACMYCHTLLGYLYARLKNVEQSYAHYTQALNQFQSPDAVIVFFEPDLSICIRKEDILFNTALILMQMGNPKDENPAILIKEAKDIADLSYLKSVGGRNSPGQMSRSRSNEKYLPTIHSTDEGAMSTQSSPRSEASSQRAVLYSPRSKVYDQAFMNRGVGFLLQEPILAKITTERTLRGFQSAHPWTLSDDYEAGNPLDTAPIDALKKSDRLGSFRFGQRRVNTNEFI